MRCRSRHTLVYAREVYEHIDIIERRYHRLIEKTIEEQLTFSADRQTRNRKPLEELPGLFGWPFDSTWELRCGPHNRFRVFYEVAGEDEAVVILTIGVKDGNRLLVGGKEFVP